MTDTTERKTTPDSTRRYRLAIAALKAIEDAQDHQVHEALGEFQSFFQLYSAAKLREVDARSFTNRPLLAAPSVAGLKTAHDHIAGQVAQQESPVYKSMMKEGAVQK